MAPASAWWPKGHSTLSEAAVQALPATAPEFFRNGAILVAHCTQDPDVGKNRGAPHLSDREGPEHFIDYEMLKGAELPKLRSGFIALCAKQQLDPNEVGFAPYAIAEWTERLALAFAEHRKWPNNAQIQTKCLVYAGFLSHYAQDLCMPLHTTIHHNGRARADGSSPRSGIHAKVDSLVEKLDMKPAALANGQQIAATAQLMPAILKEMNASRATVDRVYELEPLLPPEKGDWTASPELSIFATERARASTRFTSMLYLTAWENSAKITLPSWLER